AKLFKTRVEKFYLFFDVKFSLFKKKIGETVYGIGWLPLGGYVKIAGMIDESMDKEQMAGPPQPWEFRSKPAWQRLIIMLGGVTVNIIVGFVIYMGILYFYGRNITTNEDIPQGFAVTQQFKEYGFRDGDHILTVNGEPFEDVMVINRYMLLRDVSKVEVKHSDGSIESISVPEDVETKMLLNISHFPFSPMRLAVIDNIYQDYPANDVGFEKGDKIISVNSKPIQFFEESTPLIAANGKNEYLIVVSRNNQIDSIKVTANDEGKIGINAFGKELKLGKTEIKYSLTESIVGGFGYGYNTLKDYVSQFKYVFTKKGATQVGGFGAIGNLFPDAWDWQSFWATTALISIILAFMNILPIPALDGGHVMFLLYEIFTARKPNDKFMEYAQMVGFFILIALVLFANGNDIYRWLFE